ncbi:MAG: SH3 domain-containing protein [Ruminococcus sp.]|nr:SH3 domain-containing protein [Ruminococcus sp.]
MSKKRVSRAEEIEEYEEEAVSNWGSVIKGIIAIMITALIVIIVVMLFAKSLFITNNTAEKQTGKLTAPPDYTTVTTTTTEQVTTTKKTTTTRNKDDDPYKTSMINGSATDMTVKSAVYLHPEPNSSSANLTVLPAGAAVKAYAVVNGNWIYVEYNGQKGYAYGDFFTGERPTATEAPA